MMGLYYTGEFRQYVRLVWRLVWTKLQMKLQAELAGHHPKYKQATFWALFVLSQQILSQVCSLNVLREYW